MKDNEKLKCNASVSNLHFKKKLPSLKMKEKLDEIDNKKRWSEGSKNSSTVEAESISVEG